MRITETDQKSRVRVAELRVAISMAIGETEGTQITVSEILVALTEIQAHWVHVQRRHDVLEMNKKLQEPKI